MTIYDNDLPPGISKDSYLVNPYGSKPEGNMFHDADLNKAYGGGSGTAYGGVGASGGYSGGTSVSTPMPRWIKGFLLLLVAFLVLAYGRSIMVVGRLTPYPQTEFVLFSGKQLRINPTAHDVTEGYKAGLTQFKNLMTPLFPPDVAWTSFYRGCGMRVHCLSHPMEAVARFRKHALSADTFWNDLCNLSNYHRDEFPADIKLEWEIRTKASVAGIINPTSFSQCILKQDSQTQVRKRIAASRKRELWLGNALFGLLTLTAVVGIGVWYRRSGKQVRAKT